MKLKNLLIPSLLVLFSVLVVSAAIAEEHEEDFQKTLPLSSKGTFSLSNVNGRVAVATWKEEKVEIKALKKTNKAAKNLQKVKIEVTTGQDSVSVKTIYPRHSNTGVSVDYEVKVPEGVRLEEVSTVNGGVRVTGPFGGASVSTVNGQVNVHEASGDLRLETTNGDIETVNVKGRLRSNTTNGSIRLDLSSLDGDIHAETVNGGITLRLGQAGEMNAYLEAETVNGGIEFDFPITLQRLEKSRHRLSGQIGQGGPRIDLETVNGSIRLTR